MMSDVRQQITELLRQAEEAIPQRLKPDLPPGEHTSGAPEWYGFEHSIWALGEDIRQLLLKSKSLRSDLELHRAILRVATEPKAKRGRQSFIMLLGNAACLQFASQIADQLPDPHVCGHAIDTLTKMKCPDYVEAIEPFTRDKTTWIRNKAKRYIERYRER